MRHFSVFLLASLLAATACRPTVTPTPATATPTPATATSAPQAVLALAATLYSGPGNLAYESLAELPAGASVRVDGTFGDFVRAAALVSMGEVTGFLWKEALQSVPASLPALDVLEVPWEPMYLPSCAPGVYDPGSDSLTLATGENQYWYAGQSAVWNLETPVRVLIGKLTPSAGVQGSIGVMGSPAGAEDLWWQGVKSLGIVSVDGNYVLQILDGSSENPVASIDLQRSSSQPLQILFDQPEGRSFDVLDENNQELRHVDVTTLPGVNLPDGLFPEREFWFSVGLTGQGTLVVTGLSIGTEPEGNWIRMVDTNPGLAALAEERDLIIGTEFNRSYMIDRRYCQTMQHDFNVAVVPDITWIVPGLTFWLGPGQYDFYNVDRVVEIAQLRGWRVFGSHLLWGASEAVPDWLRDPAYTRDDYISLLQQHIQTMVEHYQGKIQYWSIANEAPERDFYYPKPWVEGAPSTNPGMEDFWYEKIGPEYIEMAFRWAREADPNAILIFNSGIGPAPYSGNGQAMADQMYATVKQLVEHHVPFDAIGMQMHLLGPLDLQVPPSKEQVLAYMQKWGDLGLRAYITELDVDLGSTPGSQEVRYAYQAQIYRDLMEACLESGVCDGLMTWGVSDSLSWIVSPKQFPGARNETNGDPLLFDWNFDPKPAYYAVRDALQGIPAPIAPTATPPPTTGQAIDTCLAQLVGAASPAGTGGSGLYDGFDNRVYDGSYDRAQWVYSPDLADSIAQQRAGVMVLGNAGGQLGVGSRLVARRYADTAIDQPMFFQADLSLCPDSSLGVVQVAINTLRFEPGSWMAGCGFELYAGAYRVTCSDFLWAGQMEDQFETPRLAVEPGTWHRVRIEVDPAALTLRYFIDGEAAGGHALASAKKFTPDQFLAAHFQFILSLWKSSVDSPLLGLVDNVDIGPIDP